VKIKGFLLILKGEFGLRGSCLRVLIFIMLGFYGRYFLQIGRRHNCFMGKYSFHGYEFFIVEQMYLPD
jgi:hypothetical protein